MARSTATMTSKGQVTVPQEIREELGLAAGTRLEFETREDGTVLVRPLRKSLLDLLGILKPPEGTPAVSVEEMNEAIGDAIAESYLRSIGRKP